MFSNIKSPESVLHAREATENLKNLIHHTVKIKTMVIKQQIFTQLRYKYDLGYFKCWMRQ